MSHIRLGPRVCARDDEPRVAVSDAVERHLDKAFASLDNVPVRELQATAEALDRRRDGLGKFSSVFRDVADAREGGWNSNIPRFHLGQAVSRADEELAERIAEAEAPFLGACARGAGPGTSVNPPPFPQAFRTATLASAHLYSAGAPQ